ncbi:hypothetical protein L7F22_006388 [Adiantum nelumboides]|nr:hypothetical protein [Adiantum nelumboides]
MLWQGKARRRTTCLLALRRQRGVQVLRQLWWQGHSRSSRNCLQPLSGRRTERAWAWAWAWAWATRLPKRWVPREEQEDDGKESRDLKAMGAAGAEEG